jgi:hypothetical protein
LVDVPAEVFRRVVKHLDPIWMWNVSHTYSFAFRALSQEGGANHLWYDAMPPAMWSEGERYQDVATDQPSEYPLNKVIGGPYRDTFDYKREIVGRFQEDRCNVCLRRPREITELWVEKHWGVKFCRLCFEAYTVGRFWFCRFLTES